MSTDATYGAGYKDAAPETTVARIREILAHLGIGVSEALFQQGEVAYSCRIAICDNGLERLNIGTNGKGLTPEYALASGYAELMERLQNKFLINEAMRFAGRRPGAEPFDFRFFPDEKTVESDLGWYIGEYIPSLFPRAFNNPDASGVRQPAATGSGKVKWKAVQYAVLTFDGPCHLIDMPAVPVRANSSTGMCAGNTPAEAIVQGICEVFERYVLQMIYSRPVTPPSFPDGYFDDTEAGRRLSMLKTLGYTYDIKDMSLGMGLPVVGLVLTNNANGTTMFRLGSDLNAEIALERCLTETFQGRQSTQDTFVDYTTSSDMDSDPTLLRAEYRKSLKDGTGRYRQELLGNTPTYTFSPPRLRRSGDSSSDLRSLVRLIDSLGMKLHVRDNSFLGFCSYHVHIPGLSEHDPSLMPVFDDYFAEIKADTDGTLSETDSIWPLYDIGSNANPADLARFIEERYTTDSTVKLAPYNISPRNLWNKHLLIALPAIKGEDYAKGAEAFGLFLSDRAEAGLPTDQYLGCVHRYLLSKAAGLSDDSITDTLSHSFPQDVADEVMSDMRIPSKVMDNYSLPTCFRCDACPLSHDCRFEAVAAIERRLQHEQTANPIDQSQLFTLL